MRKKRLIGLLSILAVVAVAAASPRGQSASVDEIVPPDNLVLDGIPKIPAPLAKAVGRYRNSFGYPLVGWDPSKRELWLKLLGSSGTWVSHLNTAGGVPLPLYSIPAGGIYDVYYQPQAKYIIYNKDKEGDEYFQFYLYDIAKRESKLITDGKSRNTEPVWSNAGDKIIYSSSPQNGNGVDLSIMRPFDPQTNRRIAEGRGHYLKAYDWSATDDRIAFCDHASNTVSTLWTIDIASGKKTLISTGGPDARDYYDSPQFTKDGRGLFVITNHDSEFRHLALVDLATRKQKSLSDHNERDVEEFKVAPDGKTIAFVVNEDGISRVHLLDTTSWHSTAVSSLPAGIISDLKWHNNSVDLAFNLKSSQTPNDVYAVDTKTGNVERWSKAILGQIDADKLPKPEVIHWKSFDNRLITGVLYRPPTTFGGKRPVIIEIHGGPEEQYRPGFGYDDNYFVNELGIVKIYPNVRGSTGYGKTFVNLDNGLLRMNVTKDIGALLDWIKSQSDLDSDRVLIQGSSYGGYVALSAAVQYGVRIRAAVSDSGPSNLVTFIEGTAGWRRDIQRQEFGDERDPKMKRVLERVAPLNNVEQMKKPVLVIQGQNDPRVPVSESRRLVSELKKRHIPVWFLLAKDEGHAWTNPTNWNFRIYSIAMFVQEQLLK